MNLARQFVGKIGGKLENLSNQPGSDSIDTSSTDDLSIIPDGETFLFKAKVGKFSFDSELYATKRNGQIYFDLADIISVLELAISYKPETMAGSGWYLREDWTTVFDLKKKEIISKNQTLPVTDKDIIIEGETAFISKDLLKKWLSIDMDIDVAQQYAKVNTPYPLAAVARDSRSKKEDGYRQNANVALLPRLETQYDMFDLNSMDVRVGTRYRKQPEGEATKRIGLGVSASGQALKHDAYVSVTGDSTEKISNVTARLSKENENPVLLGPLKARSYSVGDTNAIDLPLTGDSPQEFGFRVSNSPLEYSDFLTTDISGDGLPGFDVELYRNGTLVGTTVIEENGRYEFPDIQLFAEENDFELFFYGPQGEIRTETVNIPVTAELIRKLDNTYSASTTLTDTRTYQKSGSSDSEDEDKNTPHFAARYNKLIGDTLTYVGVRNRDISGENKTFLGTGFTKVWLGTVFDVNSGIDQDLNRSTQVSARKNLGEWKLALTGLTQDEDYNVEETDNETVLQLIGSANRSFTPWEGNLANLSLSTGYVETADGGSFQSGTLGLSDQFGRFGFSNLLNYQTSDGTAGNNEERLDDIFTARAVLGDFSLRAGIDYDIKPETKADSYFGQVRYRANSRLDGDISIDHDPETSFSLAKLNVNYTHDKIRLSPFVQYDTDQEVVAGLNLNFGLVKTPEDGLFMTSKKVAGQGKVSSFVFFDKDGNNVFDGEDEPLPEVIVESVNIRRREPTNERGYALITNLPNVRATDIHVDTASLPDPFMVSGFEGVSIFPSTGDIVELQFPIHLAGEMDGTITIAHSDGKYDYAERTDVELIPIDGKNAKAMTTTTTPDGFYVLSLIPPGHYIVNTVADHKSFSSGPGKLQTVTIGYDGTVLYGQDIKLHKNIRRVPISYTPPDPAKFISSKMGFEPIYTLKVRQGGMSKLATLLNGMIWKNASKNLFTGLQKLETEKNAKEELYVVPGNDAVASYDRCQKMQQDGVYCELSITMQEHKLDTFKTAESALTDIR